MALFAADPVQTLEVEIARMNDRLAEIDRDLAADQAALRKAAEDLAEAIATADPADDAAAQAQHTAVKARSESHERLRAVLVTKLAERRQRLAAAKKARAVELYGAIGAKAATANAKAVGKLQKTIEALRAQALEVASTRMTWEQAASSIQRLEPGSGRAAIPGEDARSVFNVLAEVFPHNVPMNLVTDICRGAEPDPEVATVETGLGL